MDKLKEYNINFSGLAEGLHEWTHHIDSQFLAQFEGSLISEADLEVKVSLEKRTHLLTFDFDLSGTVRTSCDVCTEDFDLEVSAQEMLLVKMVSETIDSDEPDVMYLEFGSSHVHIAQYLYEMVMLSLPMRKVHPEDENGQPTCDPKVLNLLQQNSSQDPAEPDSDDSNPIWDALKNLKNK